MIGRTIAHYTILGKLGEGGMGVVYKARDTHLDRMVALKFLPAEKVADPDRRRRFIQEARAASALHHPSIVTIHDIDEADGAHFIVMEYVEGKTLHQLVGRKGLRLADALNYGVQVADALARAHRAGIIHRDVKPSNIMVDEHGLVKVLDFGLAKLAEPSASAAGTESTRTAAPPRTREGSIAGTVGYMSPEQAEGKPADARSDIFSFGSVLYEMVTGERAFRGESHISTLAAILREEPKPPSTIAPQVPREFDRIVARCLRKDPAQRFQAMADVKIALEEVRQKADSGMRPDRGAARTASRVRWAVGIAALMLLLGAAAFFYWGWGRSPEPISTLAVLPFSGAEPGTGDEYLGDGIAESIIRSLSRLPGLKVRPFQAVIRFRGPNQDASAAGDRLKVRAVLVGRITRRGDDLTVTTELIDVRENTAVWGERYSRRFSDILALLEQIGREIAGQLHLRLSSEQKAGFARRSTEDAEAYQEYLRGRYFWNKRTGEALETAIAHFEKAIARDPGFALAYSGMADCYVLLPYITATPGSVAYPRAKAAALKALELDPGLAEAYPVLGVEQRDYEWKWSEAEASFRKALELNPEYPTAHQWYGEYLFFMGRFEEALAEMKRAQQLDPLSLIINKQVGDVYYAWRHYDEAIAQYKATLEMDPSFVYALEALADSYLTKHLYPEAIGAAKKALELDPKRPLLLATLAIAYTKSGQRAEAQRTFAAIEEQQKRGGFPAIFMALVHVETGDKDNALRWLEKAMNERNVYLLHLKSYEVWDPLRADPRFAALVRRMKFPA
ncbi:MAG: protein kinase [Bryobacteraceae bacterium]|jgi:TolB-like protein/Flp pilus assembly protein TadD/predicted Ser/Thr protein kinase